MLRRFRQVDVFGSAAYRGNPVAVVLDADGMTTDEMQRFASWTNLSETTFVLPPQKTGADYRVRIFTTSDELPFAGHPTLGTCHAWLQSRPEAERPATVVQECDAGLVEIRLGAGGLAFAAPPLLRYEPADDSLVEKLSSSLGLARTDIVDAHWVDNGPGWVALLLSDADAVLGVRPTTLDLPVGLVGPYPDGSPCALEVRGFFPMGGILIEDPVTGSLNASLAQWLLDTHRVAAPYVASQGKALGREGRVHIEHDDAGVIWVGGGTVTCITGNVDL